MHHNVLHQKSPTITKQMIRMKKLEAPQLLNGCVYISKNHFYALLSSRQLILPRNMYKTERKPKTKYFCGNCANELGRGFRQHPSVWCIVCGWVHFACSRLKQLKDYKRNDTFLCTKCSATRRLVQPTEETIAHSKLHDLYTTIRLLLAVELLSNRLPNAHSNKLTTISTTARHIPSLNKRAIVCSD